MRLLDYEFRERLLVFLGNVKPLPDWRTRVDTWIRKRLNGEQLKGRLRAALWSNKDEELDERLDVYYKLILRALYPRILESKEPVVILDCDHSTLTLKEELLLMHLLEASSTLLTLMQHPYSVKRMVDIGKETILDVAWLFCSKDELKALSKRDLIHVPIYGLQFDVNDAVIYKAILDLVT